MNVKLLQGFQIYIATGTKGEPYDAALVGWFADYADPYDFIDILLNGENIHEANNNNLAYLNVPALNKQMRAANALTGDKRSAAYQNARPRDHHEVRPVGGVREPQHPRVRVGSHRRLPVPGRTRCREPEHLLPQVGRGHEPFSVGAGLDPAPTRVQFGVPGSGCPLRRQARTRRAPALSSVPSWTFERGMRPPAEEITTCGDRISILLLIDRVFQRCILLTISRVLIEWIPWAVPRPVREDLPVHRGRWGGAILAPLRASPT